MLSLTASAESCTDPVVSPAPVGSASVVVVRRGSRLVYVLLKCRATYTGYEPTYETLIPCVAAPLSQSALRMIWLCANALPAAAECCTVLVVSPAPVGSASVVVVGHVCVALCPIGYCSCVFPARHNIGIVVCRKSARALTYWAYLYHAENHVLVLLHSCCNPVV